MKYDPHKHHRRSIRLKGYDYSQAGAYFVTICVNGGQSHLGKVVNGEMILSDAGMMVYEAWDQVLDMFPNVELYIWGPMPNHVHFILFILEQGLTAEQRSVVLGNVVGAYKSITTNGYIDGVHNKDWTPFRKRFWLRNYWERIIRNERELEAIREYILNNPAKWEKDKLNPGAEENKFNRDFKRPD